MRTVAFLLLLLILPPLGAQGTSRKNASAELEALRVEVEELRTAVRTLRAENERLEARNRRLMDDILNLGQQIQALRARETPMVAEPRPEPTQAPTSLAVIYVNAQWHYVILDGGSAQGLREGQIGKLVRGDDLVLGTVRISDVKATQAVGELDPAALAEVGAYPRPGDRVVMP